MNKDKMKRIVTVAIITGSTVLATGPAFAQTPTPTPVVSHPNFFSGLITFIAQKFGLDENQVKSAVNDYKTQQQAKMQQVRDDREKTRLDQLVKDGKITSSQETAILNEEASLKSKYNPANLKNLTADQRKAQFDAMQQEIQTWAKDNNIDPKYLMPNFGIGMRMGIRRGGWRNNHSAKPTPTPTP